MSNIIEHFSKLSHPRTKEHKKNTQGDVTYIDNRVFKIYQNNKTVSESISQEFEMLNNDSNVTGFKLLDKNDKPIVQIPK
jgi:hypothetical protein